jgi:hypothetical protein
MNFIDGLPRINGKTFLLTIIDRFSKAAHFIPLNHPYTATTVAHTLFNVVVCLHGILNSIISDRDPVFASSFWHEMFSLSGVNLNLSSAFHPQYDGQAKATNKINGMYLRCLSGDWPRDWLRWLPWVEFCYNLVYQSSLCTLPFRVVYGQEPSLMHAYTAGEACLLVVQQEMEERDEFLMEIREHLHQAQQHYKTV